MARQTEVSGSYANDIFDRHKARLVVQGYAQEHDIDYDETFAPVIKMTTIRTLIALASIRFIQSKHDKSMFIRTTKHGICVILLHVDDILISVNDFTSIKDVKLRLQEYFQMKDLREASDFLGLEISCSKRGIYIYQQKYALDLVSSIQLNDVKVVDTPIELNVKLSVHVGDPLLEPTMYCKLVGFLIYLTMTRLDIAYIVHIVSQFISDPR
ncbi:uncharacterized protein LOC110007612 [Amborella trichopoda]|uniref:uncharacterized protein LOC110007612 n=1 Tax=Amborella trichopoda TaxID=13333 RepID=UPI0009BF5043|nr:uncharacterized protein LOC110007612 [Amborella trichopoda]|eukprot:XP_020525380.1 uncharacterized protein LOC110007612 [Amborella trichopoda]